MLFGGLGCARRAGADAFEEQTAGVDEIKRAVRPRAVARIGATKRRDHGFAGIA